jgi:hypothetical protein
MVHHGTLHDGATRHLLHIFEFLLKHMLCVLVFRHRVVQRCVACSPGETMNSSHIGVGKIL